MSYQASMSDSARPPARTSSRYFLSLQRGRNIRAISLHPAALFSAIALAALTFVGFAGASAYIFFRDDILRALVAQHRSSEHAYQMRIANLQTQLDRVSTRQLIDQETLESRIVELAARQARVESRSATLASLADLAGVPKAAAPPRGREQTAARPTVNPLLGTAAPALPAGVSSYASPGQNLSTVTRPTPLPADSKPQPQIEPPASELFNAPAPGARPDGLRTSSLAIDPAIAADRAIPMATRARALSASLEHIELAQVGAIDRIAEAANQKAAALEAAFAAAGLNPRSMKTPKNSRSAATGGPFIPLVDAADKSAFGSGVRRLQEILDRAQTYARVLPYVPLRQPLAGTLDITSTFGGRSDPFYGRAAMHSGIDMRDETGSPVRATAAGRVTFAGSNGGYGNMVEIDHGNGLTTRYAHLSAIDVVDNQWVDAGQICGRLGSTGRSTGPHLHYEVRIDGDAVDPARFLRAGGRIPASVMASAIDLAKTARQ